MIGEEVTCIDAGEGSHPRGSRRFSKDWAGDWLGEIRDLVVEELVDRAVAINIGGWHNGFQGYLVGPFRRVVMVMVVGRRNGVEGDLIQGQGNRGEGQETGDRPDEENRCCPSS